MSPSLVLGGVALPQTDPVYNLGILLDSGHMLCEQVAIMDRRSFVQLCFVYQLCLFLDEGALLMITHALVTF